MYIGIGSFYLQVTRQGLLVEMGRLFGMHASREDVKGAPRFAAQLGHTHMGTRSWTIYVGPIEIVGSVLWPSFLTVEDVQTPS